MIQEASIPEDLVPELEVRIQSAFEQPESLNNHKEVNIISPVSTQATGKADVDKATFNYSAYIRRGRLQIFGTFSTKRASRLTISQLKSTPLCLLSELELQRKRLIS